MCKRVLTLVLVLVTMLQVGVFTSSALAVDSVDRKNEVSFVDNVDRKNAVSEKIKSLTEEYEILLKEYYAEEDLAKKFEIGDKLLDIEYSIEFKGAITSIRFWDKEMYIDNGFTDWDTNKTIYDSYTGEYVS